MRRLAICTILAVALTSCAHTRRIQMTGCDHPSGWSQQVRSMAEGAYQYAMLAVNAYDDSDDAFEMPSGWRKLGSFPNNQHGMAYDVWSYGDAPNQEIVLAFRGTEFTHLTDWRDGNFGTKQNADGVAAFDEWRARYPNARFAVSGHSLGGGIATQISLSRPNVRSFIFNSSPRFKAPQSPERNARVSVVEYGEVLKIVRILGREATQDYYSIGCRGGLPVAQHGSKPLAECIMQIASWDMPMAKKALNRNNVDAPEPANPPGSHHVDAALVKHLSLNCV